MDLTEFRVPREKAAPTGPGAGPWRTAARLAGFFGAFPFAVLPFYLTTGWQSPLISTSEYLFGGLLGILPLVPFAAAMSRAGWDAWPRTLALVISAMTACVLALPLYFFLNFWYLAAAGGLGLVLGLAALGPCWWKGDREGRALALLGPAPALWLLGYQVADRLSRRYPGLTAVPDLSWLLRWEYLLALVAVGLAVGALRLFRLRRRLARAGRPRGLDDGGAATSPEVNSPVQEVPPLDVTPVAAGPLKEGEDGGRPERFRRHARALGVVWVVFGSIPLLIGVGNLWAYLPPLGSAPDARELRQILSCGALAAYGLALAAAGVGTRRRSTWAIGAGLALSGVVPAWGIAVVFLASGIAVDDLVISVSLVALSLSLIDPALRTIGLAGPPRHGDEPRRGLLAALQRVPAHLAEAPPSRPAVAFLGCSFGAVVGSLTGAVAGSLLISLAALANLVTNQWGLATVVGLALGGLGGGAGGWVGGLIQGATLGVSSPRIKAVGLYGGTVSGLMVVLVASVKYINWSRRGWWFELLEISLLTAATGALGAVTAGVAVGRLARAFDDRAGAEPLKD